VRSKLDKASEELLKYVDETSGFVSVSKLSIYLGVKTGLSIWDQFWFRRLVALALEGYIKAKVYREGDEVSIRFRRKEERDR